MEEAGSSESVSTSVQVAVRVRPINDRERNEGHRTCVTFDDPTKQVVLTAVDKNTLLQLRGASAKGFAFDRRYGQQCTSDEIYDDCIAQLVESCFKGYNATVLAYGQTGSGKTHTMSGGVGIHGRREEGVTPRVIRHLYQIAEQLNKKAKPGEKIEISATALELYNEDLLDLSLRSGREESKAGWDSAAKQQGSALKLQERPVGKDGRVVPEVVGLREFKYATASELLQFYGDCMENRSVSSTKLNDASSRSHAIFTVTINRTMVEVLNELGEDMRAKVRTTEFTSKLHLVDLAGSERVKRSGVTGKELKEATHINSGLLALGNVISALSSNAESSKRSHIPYRDSKLTRLLQDSLGGNSLTVLISCISPSEMDFEETNNTLKYANRACSIKNTPLPLKFTALEEDLLPSVPQAAGLGLVQLQALLEDHERMKEIRERKEREKREKEAKRLAELKASALAMQKQPGYHRVRASAYDEIRRQLAGKGATNIPQGQVIADDVLVSFGRNSRLTASTEGLTSPNSAPRTQPQRPQSTSKGSVRKIRSVQAPQRGQGAGQSFADWLASQQANEDGASSQGGGQDEDPLDFIVEDDQLPSQSGSAGEGAGEDPSEFIVDDEADVTSTPARESESGAAAYDSAAPTGKSKFRRGPQLAQAKSGEGVAGLAGSMAGVSLRASETGASSVDAQGGLEDRPSQTPSQTAESDGQGVTGTAAQAQQGAGEDTHVDTQGPAEEPAAEEDMPYDPIEDDAIPKLLARFKVNTTDTLCVFKAVSKEDFQDVVSLLPANTPLPASDKMTYLLARLESGSNAQDINTRLSRVAAGEASLNEAVGPAVGCLMATFATNMISNCIFAFPDPDELKHYDVDERIELWGLQIPHNSARPQLQEGEAQEDSPSTITWTSVDRLNMSIGLLYALCNHAYDVGVRCGFCVPRPQLLRRWLQAGVLMRQIQPPSALQLIYPSNAHDYEYYKASTVAYFLVEEVRDALTQVLALVS